MRRNYDVIINKFDLKSLILDYSQSKYVQSQLKNTEIENREKNLVIKRIKEGKKITGFVPYTNKLTCITIYNFFSTNYGDRGKGSLLISLTDENFKIIKSFHREIKLRETLCIELNDLNFSDIDYQPIFCVVSLVSNKINKNHGSWNGNFRFWGSWSDYSAFVHSFPFNSSRYLASKLGIHKDIYLERMFYPKNAEEVIHYGIHKKPISFDFRGDVSGSVKTSPGYTCIKDSQGNISSVHHLAPFVRNTALTKDITSKENIVGIPPIKGIDVEMFFGEYCSKGSKIKLTLCQNKPFENNTGVNKIQSINYKFESNNASLKASQIFTKFLDIEKDIETWISVEPIEGKFRRSYVNVIYCNALTEQNYDAVHALNITDHKKYESRTLKFSPCIISETKTNVIKRNSFLMIVANRKFDVRARLRFYNSSDSHKEFIYLLDIQKCYPKIINLNEILPSTFHQESIIICQLESEESNLDACMFISKFENGELKSMATDHLTGG